jgi:hypothetical protein
LLWNFQRALWRRDANKVALTADTGRRSVS